MVGTYHQTLPATEVRIANFTPCSPLKQIPSLVATAQVLGDRLCVNTRSGVWKQALQDNSGIALAVIAHEHYHVWQHQLGCLSPPWNKEYDWLIEGGAQRNGAEHESPASPCWAAQDIEPAGAHQARRILRMSRSRVRSSEHCRSIAREKAGVLILSA